MRNQLLLSGTSNPGKGTWGSRDETREEPKA